MMMVDDHYLEMFHMRGLVVAYIELSILIIEDACMQMMYACMDGWVR